MIRKVLIICSLFVSFILQSCAMRSNYTEDISKYGDWNKTTQEILSHNFSNSLPSKDTVNDYGQKYYYCFDQGSLGDANFVIYTVLQITDKSVFDHYLENYSNLLSSDVPQNDITYYTFQYSTTDATEYTNDKIDDGMFYNFEIISVDRSKNMICCVNARVWDYYSNEVLINYLDSIDHMKTGDVKTGDGSLSQDSSKTGDGSLS